MRKKHPAFATAAFMAGLLLAGHAMFDTGFHGCWGVLFFVGFAGICYGLREA